MTNYIDMPHGTLGHDRVVYLPQTRYGLGFGRAWFVSSNPQLPNDGHGLCYLFGLDPPRYPMPAKYHVNLDTEMHATINVMTALCVGRHPFK